MKTEPEVMPTDTADKSHGVFHGQRVKWGETAVQMHSGKVSMHSSGQVLCRCQDVRPNLPHPHPHPTVCFDPMSNMI